MTIKKIAFFLFITVGFFTTTVVSAESTATLHPKKHSQDSILKNLKKKQQLAKTLDNKDSIISSELALLRFYTYNQPKNKETKELFHLLDYCENRYNLDCLIETNVMLAVQMQKKDKYLQALTYYNKANELSLTYKKKTLKWAIAINQGTLFNELLEPELARENFRKSLDYIKPHQDYLKAISLMNISSTFEKTDPDSLIYFSNKAIDLLKENPDQVNSLEIAANNAAYGYIKKNQLTEASNIIHKYIDLDKISESRKEVFGSFFFNTLGELNYKLKNYNKAIDYYKKSINDTNTEYPPSNLSSLNDLAEISEIQGNLEQSIYYLKAKEKYLKKINQHNLKKEIARSEYNKILAEKNQLITTLENKNIKTNRQVYNIKIIALSYVVITVICILFFLTIYQKSRLKIAQLNEEISLTRLKSLRSIMNPHFLFNSFNTLQSFILQKDKFEASEHMRQLSQLIRKILSSSDSLYISFKEELEIIKTYITLENKRFDNQFILNLTIDDDLIELNPKIPSMIIQPHLENAVIHGLSSKNKKELKLSFKKKKNCIQCIIEDNGIGRRKSAELNKKSTNSTHLSIASGNTLERIRLLKKVGYKETSMKITDLLDSNKKPKGTRVTVNLPIIS